MSDWSDNSRRRKQSPVTGNYMTFVPMASVDLEISTSFLYCVGKLKDDQLEYSQTLC